MLNSEHLYDLLQVAKYNSITIAAEKTHVSQPTISMAIKKLEDQLGVQLFKRSLKGSYLTDKGRKVAEYASVIFEYMDKIEEVGQDDRADEVIIYATPPLYDILGQVIPRYHRVYPLGKFYLCRLETDDFNALFAEEPNAFIASVFLKNAVFDDELDYIVLDDNCRSSIQVQSESPWVAKDQTSITFAELLKLPLIKVSLADPDEQVITQAMFQQLKQHGEPNVAFDVPSMNIAVSYVENGLGVSFYFDSYLLRNVRSETARIIPVEDGLTYQVILLFKKGHEASHVRRVKRMIENA